MIQEMRLGIYFKRKGENLGARVWRGPESNELWPDGDGAIIEVVGQMVDAGFN